MHDQAGVVPRFYMPQRKKLDASKNTLRLYNTVWDLAEIVGAGDKTAGIEKLFSQLPLFYRVKLYLEQRAEEDPIAEALLQDMEELEIDRVYEEAIAEGVIKRPSGAWIVE